MTSCPGKSARDAAQRLRRPIELVLVSRAMLGLEIADQRAKVSGNRPQLRRVGSV